MTQVIQFWPAQSLLIYSRLKTFKQSVMPLSARVLKTLTTIVPTALKQAFENGTKPRHCLVILPRSFLR